MKASHRILTAAASALALTVFAVSAHAQGSVMGRHNMDMGHSMPTGVGAWPKLGYELAVDAEYDHYSPKVGPDTGALDVDAGLQTLLEFDNHWSVSNLLTLESNEDSIPGEDNFLTHHGLFAEELYVRWNNQKLNVKAGKFAQNFARGWFLVPGLYGGEFTGDYGIGETLGVEAQFDIAPVTYGLHQISVSAFTADTTVLSESVFYNRGRLTHADGGPGNAGGLKSYVISYDATNVPLGARGGALNYQASYASLAKGFGGDGPERRTSVGADVNIPLNWSIAETLSGRFSELRIFAEGVRLNRADGIDGQKRDYLTGAMEYVRGPWVFDFTASERWSDAPFTPRERDTTQSLAIGYSLPSDTFVALGLAHDDVGGQSGTFFGFQLSQAFTQCDRCLIKGRHY